MSTSTNRTHPTLIGELLASPMRPGRLAWIGLRAERRATVIEVTEASLIASPAQQPEIGQGILAIKDAPFDACTIEGRLCTRAFDYAMTTLSGTLSDEPAPWMDEQGKRTQPPPPSRPAN